MSFIKAGVIGHPISHSKSPIIHGHWIAQHGLNGSYTAIDIAPEVLADRVAALVADGYAGFNVTVPHKETIFRLCDAIDETAMAIGAVNTIAIRDGKIHGTNTDAFGFIENIRSKAEIAVIKKAVVLGAGGAARAAIYGLLQAGVKQVVVTNRTLVRAEDITAMDQSRVSVAAWAERSTILDDVDLLVNTTSLGMTGKEPLEIDLSGMKADGIVYDIVYAPLMTPLLIQAQARGLHIVTGIGMLLHQARGGFELWFGVLPTVTPDLEAKVLA